MQSDFAQSEILLRESHHALRRSGYASPSYFFDVYICFAYWTIFPRPDQKD